MFKKNCCDGMYNSLDVHFTSVCDNKCAHCIDSKFDGLGIKRPDVQAICYTIIANSEGLDDVLFLGGEPCLYLQDLVDCVKTLKDRTSLKLYVTTSVPKVCFDQRDLFIELIDLLDGINLSVQNHDEAVADCIRRTISKYIRQEFYRSLPHKDKIRINLNIVKPFLYTHAQIVDCLKHYDEMGFSEIKLSEIQHGKDYFVSFEDVFGVDFGSPYFKGCQTYVDTFKWMKTPLLLKRSCFLCEDTLKASAMDGVKLLHRLFNKPSNKYGVVYEDGSLSKGWR